MTWTEFTSNAVRHADRLKARFPHIDENTVSQVRDHRTLVDHVARRHDLTQAEAREEIDDWLFAQAIERQRAALRAG